MLDRVARNLRYSVRMLRKSPLFTVAEADRLVHVYRHWPGMDYGSVSIPHYQDLRDRTTDVFESSAAWSFEEMSLAAGGQSERLIGMSVSANFFQTFGVTPAFGRAFIPGEEDRGPGAHPVVVLGHSFWQTRFGGDEGVVGRTINLNGNPFREGMRLAFIGGVIGLAAAAARLLGGMLYNVSPFDPVAFVAVPVVLGSVAALAFYVPAGRAARLDPILALRAE